LWVKFKIKFVSEKKETAAEAMKNKMAQTVYCRLAKFKFETVARAFFPVIK